MLTVDGNLNPSIIHITHIIVAAILFHGHSSMRPMAQLRVPCNHYVYVAIQKRYTENLLLKHTCSI